MSYFKDAVEYVYDWWVDSSKQEVTAVLVAIIVLQIIF